LPVSNTAPDPAFAAVSDYRGAWDAAVTASMAADFSFVAVVVLLIGSPLSFALPSRRALKQTS
jgi:hypothetical protein